MRYFSWTMILLLSLILAAPAPAGFLGETDQEVQKIAEPLLEGLLAGFNADDYPKYSQNFDQTLKEAISEKEFKRVRENILKNIGKYHSRKYLGFMKKGQTTVVLWKGAFAGTEDDILIKLVASNTTALS